MRASCLSCLLAGVAAWLGLGVNSAAAVEKPQGRQRHAAVPAVDPDETPGVINGFAGDIAAGESGCDTVGSFTQPFVGADRFRGNAFRVTEPVTLLSFEMQLQFSGTTDLYFSVHRALSGQVAPDYERLEDGSGIPVPDMVTRVTGSGTPVFYSSGPLANPLTGALGLPLEVGYDYVLAVTWGTVSVTYARDQLSYPRPFAAGNVLGLVADNFPPPAPDALPLDVFGNGAYAQRLCFAGACCTTTGCVELGSGDCAARAGQFTAPGVSCAVVDEEGGCPLPRFACCSGLNCLNLNRFLCESQGSVWNNGVGCADVANEPCAPRGRCCLPDGSCVADVTRDRCALLRGSYGGDGVPCSAEPTCSAGACCAGESCNFVLSRLECDEANGRFAGPGVPCSPNPCARTGACCTGTTCQDGVTKSDCTGGGGAYRGDDTTCATIQPLCGRGACCVAGAGCVDSNGVGVTQSLCSATLGGVFRGDGSTCATIVPRCPGLCCWAICSDAVTPEDCASLPGRFAGYSSFCPSTPQQEDPCATVPTVGACCLSGGGCTVTTLQLCAQSLKGAFKGGGTTCASVDCTPPPVTGACCTGDPSTCQSGVTQANCSAGRWFRGVTCGAETCLFRGACCDRTDPANPICTDDVLETACASAVQTFSAETLCGGEYPPCGALGACCDINVFQCIDSVTVEACVGVGRLWDPDGDCETLSCDPPMGACCTIIAGQSVCSVTDRAACRGIDGVYHGDDTVCAGTECGACCTLPDSCVDNVLLAVPEDCPAPSVFYPAGVCAADCIDIQACCVAEAPSGLGCDDLAVDDCTTRGGTPLGFGTACVGADFNGNGRDDACDLPGDCDGNDQIDEADWLNFTSCMLGPGSTSPETQCLCSDLDDDGYVDLRDAWLLVPTFVPAP